MKVLAKLWPHRMTSWAALGFVAAAAGFGILDWTTNVLAAWTPNLGASCLEIAATIMIVDRIVRNEARRRAKPLIDSAHHALGDAVRRLVDELEYDLALARAASFDEPAHMPTERSLAEVADDALAWMGTHKPAASAEIDEARASNLNDALARSIPILDRRLAVDRDLLAPRLVAALEAATEMLVRRVPLRPLRRMEAYRLARSVTLALQILKSDAEAYPEVGAFVETYVNEPRRLLAELEATL